MFRRFWVDLRRLAFERGPELAVILFVLVFLVVYFSPRMFYNVPAGHFGVLWSRFGGGIVLNRVFGEGFHTIFPWDRFYIYDARLQIIHEDFHVLSSNGLRLTISISYRFQLVPKEIPGLAKYVGPNYQSIMVSPVVAARARDVFSRNTPEEIFALRRDVINKKIATAVQYHLDHDFIPPWRKKPIHFIQFWDVLIRQITLPPALQAAIDNKNVQQQINEGYDFRLLREAKEAERKRIEATGVKEFQDIVSPGLTNNYLRWRGIEATLALANSSNAKIVIIGSGKGGLPVILGNLWGGKAGGSAGAKAQGGAPQPLQTPSAPSAGKAAAPSAPMAGSPAKPGSRPPSEGELLLSPALTSPPPPSAPLPAEVGSSAGATPRP